MRRRRGWWLRQARERTGMTQLAVAHELGLSTGTAVVHWEKGERDPSVAQLALLADLYGVPVETFTKPETTAEERLEQFAHGSTALALRDGESEASRARGAGDRPGAPRGTRRP